MFQICVDKGSSHDYHQLMGWKWSLPLCTLCKHAEGRGRAGSLFHWIQFSSVVQSSPTLCDPVNRSKPGLPIHHQLPQLTQTHVHWVGDAIQPSHPLSSPSTPAFDLSQHQGLFQWVSSSHQVTKVLEFQLQHQSFQNTQGWSALGSTGWISLQSKGLSRVFSNTTLQKYQFFSAQLSSQSNSHIHIWPLEKPQPCLDGLLLAK